MQSQSPLCNPVWTLENLRDGNTKKYPRSSSKKQEIRKQKARAEKQEMGINGRASRNSMFAGCFPSRSRVRDVSEIQRLVLRAVRG
ncbi:unnamed protein product [Lasius platythorax]|uniref:Uncharacterized protein n=1 Tax=Lasius platythorax TaxID=488582 RepID=A0AAV2NJ04_9HYME